MPSSSPSYITKNRLGIYILQMRVPAHIRQNCPNARALIQRSLHTRNRREALRSARKMVVMMEENDFDMEGINAESELFHVGNPLFKELNHLLEEGDHLVTNDFLAHLTPHEDEALSFVAEMANAHIDRLQGFLKAGDHQKAIDYSDNIPKVFKKDIRKRLKKHVLEHPAPPPTATPLPQPAPSPRSHKDVKLDAAFETWQEALKPPAMAASSFEEYKRMIAFFLRSIEYVTQQPPAESWWVGDRGTKPPTEREGG